MIAPTVKSFTRLIPGFWAPTEASWGIDNRTCALRGIPGSAKSQRVEYHIATAGSNPYLPLAASVGAGLWGMENKIEPEKPVERNVYEKPSRRNYIYRQLYEAAGRLKTSKPARKLLGGTFVDHYAASRK